MSIPDFSKIAWQDSVNAALPAGSERVADPRGHSGQAGLWPGRCRGPRLPRHLSGYRALPARPLPGDVRHPAVDDPAICRLLDRGGFQRLLPPQPGGGTEGPLGRVRPRHPSWLRQRSSPRPRRCRHGGRGDQLDLRHAHAVLRHPARPDVGVDDDERRGAAGARALYRRRRGTGRAAGEALGHDPERHPQRIHGAQHLHLSAGAIVAHHFRHLRLHLGAHAEVQFDLDLRLSHAGSRARRRTWNSPTRLPTASNTSAPA